ncbi:flagellar assembly protein FliH, partial [Desulfovibrio sp. OttesenSCG-928-M14]|nr:flagellar assembly protein FliH [Desulfovibrio sp. OttesenSCG-928-M14]
VNLLEKRRELIIRVNPEDEPALNDIVVGTQERFPDVKSWRVRADATISPGGLVVESEASLVEGRLESRTAIVEDVLRRLTLPEHSEEGGA